MSDNTKNSFQWLEHCKTINPEFIQLWDYYNGLLYEEDAELHGKNTGPINNTYLKRWSSNTTAQYNEFREEYYRRAAQFYYNGNFNFLRSKTFTPRQIKRAWKLHSDGLILDEIADKLSTEKQEFNSKQVWGVIDLVRKKRFYKWVEEESVREVKELLELLGDDRLQIYADLTEMQNQYGYQDE